MIFGAKESLTNEIIGLLVCWCLSYLSLRVWALFPNQAFTQPGGQSR